MTPVRAEKTSLRGLKRGDIFYGDVLIDCKELANKESANRHKQTVHRVATGHTGVQVTYFATLGSQYFLPDNPTKEMQYPFKPAKKQGPYDLLPKHPNDIAQWASLRAVQRIDEEEVEKIPGNLPPASVNALHQAMLTEPPRWTWKERGCNVRKSVRTVELCMPTQRQADETMYFPDRCLCPIFHLVNAIHDSTTKRSTSSQRFRKLSSDEIFVHTPDRGNRYSLWSIMLPSMCEAFLRKHVEVPNFLKEVAGVTGP
ncbi:hypothetical protein EDD16DRAFT_1519628 [Pisolithus croceorrhizus]|nr:hypothetical protein EDD16DRAFT_1519628 [Pisolithus croceorrhizus]KAI6164038.1 hypothetical protein EDD17DRAFT_1506910 [Pisolithus thermaeus]